MALDNNVGVQLPGSTEESYNYGRDYSNLAPLNSAIPGMPDQLLPDSQSMGAESMPVGLAIDTDAQFGNIPLFDNPQPNTNNDPQWTSDTGIPNDSHVEILRDEQMYGSATPLPFVPIAETAEPEIEGA